MSWTCSDSEAASLFCLPPSDAVGGQLNITYTHTAPAVDQGETYCHVLTDDGATLRTFNIVCADFHPAVEVHLSER